jgi:hypothetical protein
MVTLSLGLGLAGSCKDSISFVKYLSTDLSRESEFLIVASRIFVSPSPISLIISCFLFSTSFCIFFEQIKGMPFATNAL